MKLEDLALFPPTRRLVLLDPVWVPVTPGLLWPSLEDWARWTSFSSLAMKEEKQRSLSPSYIRDNVCDQNSHRFGVSPCGSMEMNLTSIYEDVGLIPGLAQWVKNPALP